MQEGKPAGWPLTRESLTFLARPQIPHRYTGLYSTPLSLRGSRRAQETRALSPEHHPLGRGACLDLGAEATV
jgi:hypothetical protein